MCLRLFLCLCLCLFQFLCLCICLRLYLFLCVFLDLYVYACAHICILRSAFITRHCLTHFTQDSTRTKFFHKSEFAHPHLFSQLSPPDPPPFFEIHAEEFDLRTFLAQCEFARLYLCSHLFLPPSPLFLGLHTIGFDPRAVCTAAADTTGHMARFKQVKHLKSQLDAQCAA